MSLRWYGRSRCAVSSQQPRECDRGLTARFPFVCPLQEYFADYLTLLPSLFTLSLPPVSPTPKVGRSLLL